MVAMVCVLEYSTPPSWSEAVVARVWVLEGSTPPPWSEAVVAMVCVSWRGKSSTPSPPPSWSGEVRNSRAVTPGLGSGLARRGFSAMLATKEELLMNWINKKHYVKLLILELCDASK